MIFYSAPTVLHLNFDLLSLSLHWVTDSTGGPVPKPNSISFTHKHVTDPSSCSAMWDCRRAQGFLKGALDFVLVMYEGFCTQSLRGSVPWCQLGSLQMSAGLHGQGTHSARPGDRALSPAALSPAHG